MTTESLVQSALAMSNSHADEDAARKHSQLASAYLQQEKFDESLSQYSKAAALYEGASSSETVSLANAAGCFRNMGAVCRRLGDFDSAIRYLQTAEEQYKRVERADKSLHNLCLDVLLIESLQSRATFHFRKQGELEQAINCHEECVTRLTRDPPTRFMPLTPQQNTELLVVSVENLSGMYRMDPTLATECRLQQLQDGIRILRIRRDEARTGDSEDDSLLLPLTQSLRYLSEIYLETGQMDKAVDAMHDAMDIDLASAKDPSVEALDAMDKLGAVNEDLGNLDKALVCYEKAMFARSRMYGDDHVGVAKDLVNVARIMELQGNSEGSLDLYRAAHTIYSKWVASDNFACDKDDAEAILQLIPNLFAQHRFQEARAFLTKCLEVADQLSEPDEAFDKSQIYFDLGQASIGMEDFVSATIFLMEAANTQGSVSGSEVVSLLERVEALQKDRHRNEIRVSRSWEAGEAPSRTRGMDRTSASKRESSVPTRIIHTAGNLNVPALVSPGRESVGRERSLSTSRHSNYMSSGSTIPTVDASDNDRWPTKSLFDSPDSAGMSSFLPHDPLGAESILDTTVDDDQPSDAEEEQKHAPLLSPSVTLYSDEALEMNPSPVTSEGRKKSRGVSLWGPNGTKKSKDDRSTGSQQFSSISKVFGGSLARRRKLGFQSLPENDQQLFFHDDELEILEPDLRAVDTIEESDGIELGIAGHVNVEPPTEMDVENDDHDVEEETKADSDYQNTDGPCLVIHVDELQDDISEITMKIPAEVAPKTTEDSSTGTNNQEWWWGVTSEGFGRWFPSSYVSQAVQAADNFLSAKAIHSKSRHVPAAAQALASLSDDESDDNLSIDPQDFASNAGVGSMAVKPDMRRSYKRHAQLGSNLQPPLDSGKDVASEILIHKELLESQRRAFGDAHPKVATTLFTLAVLHSRDSDARTAIKCATEALTIQQSNGNHGDAARSLHFLGDLKLHEKKYQESLFQYEKALRHETICFGFYSDETARTRNCIGTVKLLQNKFIEAMESHEEALKILKECHGEDIKHPLVSETLCQIGSVYYRERNSVVSTESSQDDYTTFIELGMLEVIGQAHEDRGSYRMAISFYEEKLQVLESNPQSDENFAEIAMALSGLGMLSVRAGLYAEALDYYSRAVRLQHQLGCSQVDLAAAQVLTGSVHFLLGRWDKATRQLEDALEILVQNLGPRHETVAAAHYQLGMVKAAYYDFDSAMDSLSEALDIQSELLGEDHPAALRTRREIGNLYAVYEAELDSAFDNFYFVLEAQKKIHGDRHPNLAETLQSIGSAYARKREYSEALRTLEDCYYMRVEFLGWDHPLQATTLHDIAKIQLQRGRVKKASQICQIIMTIRQDSLSERHIDVAKTRLTQGKCLIAQGNTDEATLCLMEALAIVEEKLGLSHPLVAEVHTEIGSLYLRKCQFDMARESIQKALDIYDSSHLDDDYFGYQEAKLKMNQVERDEMLCV